MADPGYFAINININPGNDACIIFAQPTSHCLTTILDCIKNLYDIEDELHKDVVKKATLATIEVEGTDISIKSPKLKPSEECVPVEDVVKVEVIACEEKHKSPEHEVVNENSVFKISSFVFINEICHFCELQCTSERELSDHFYEKHEPLNVQRSDGRYEYQCKGCGKQFYQYPPAVKHCMVKVKEIYQCPQCKTTIQQTSNIKRHLKRCSGAEAFPCSKCHQFIKSKSNFERHF